LLTGWLCARGGTDLAFAVAGIIGIVATIGAAGALRRRPPIQIPRHAEHARAA
jgi:hypothetical protein